MSWERVCVPRLKRVWTNKSGWSGEQWYFMNTVINGMVRAGEVTVSPTCNIIEVDSSVMCILQAEGGNVLREDYRSIVIE